MQGALEMLQVRLIEAFIYEEKMGPDTLVSDTGTKPGRLFPTCT
jgi:hypothetical protein